METASGFPSHLITRASRTVGEYSKTARRIRHRMGRRLSEDVNQEISVMGTKRKAKRVVFAGWAGVGELFLGETAHGARFSHALRAGFDRTGVRIGIWVFLTRLEISFVNIPWWLPFYIESCR